MPPSARPPPARPQTLREAKAAYKKRSGTNTLTEADLRRIARQEEQFKRAQRERDREIKKRENKRKREEKEARDRETRKRMGRDREMVKVPEGQERMDGFLKKRRVEKGRREEDREKEAQRRERDASETEEKTEEKEEKLEERWHDATRENTPALRVLSHQEVNAGRRTDTDFDDLVSKPVPQVEDVPLEEEPQIPAPVPEISSQDDTTLEPDHEVNEAVLETDSPRDDIPLRLRPEAAEDSVQPPNGIGDSFGEWADLLVSNSQLERELSTQSTPERITMPPPPKPVHHHTPTPPRRFKEPSPVQDDFSFICTQDLEFSADDMADLHKSDKKPEAATDSFEFSPEEMEKLLEFEAGVGVSYEINKFDDGLIAEASDDAWFAGISSQELQELAT